jgi:triphosphoribosyl-dephospho-CoA synthase
MRLTMFHRDHNYAAPRAGSLADRLADAAAEALTEELDTYPKPGMVSFHDNGSHRDMTASMFLVSIAVLKPFFAEIAAAGYRRAGLADLRRIGRQAEKAMLAATGGVNTHRGAIFSLGLLCAAAGYAFSRGVFSDLPADGLGKIIAAHWGPGLDSCQEYAGASHGAVMYKKYGAGGARREAAGGFASVRRIGLPAFTEALRGFSPAVARTHCFFALLEAVPDTTLMYRGGLAGMHFAREQARVFNARGGVKDRGWRRRAQRIHREFIDRNLSAGGVADLLAATLLVHKIFAPGRIYLRPGSRKWASPE